MVKIIEKHSKHLDVSKYRLNCIRCGSIVELEACDFELSEPDFEKGLSTRTFCCPVCDKYYNLGFKEDKACFDEVVTFR